MDMICPKCNHPLSHTGDREQDYSCNNPECTEYKVTVELVE